MLTRDTKLIWLSQACRRNQAFSDSLPQSN
jgi:hypothetical protein